MKITQLNAPSHNELNRIGLDLYKHQGAYAWIYEILKNSKIN